MQQPRTSRRFAPGSPHRGQATIELALVFIFILLPLLIGLADLGRAYYEHLAVTHAANVGARWLTLSPTQQYCSGLQTVEDAIHLDLGNAVTPEQIVLPIGVTELTQSTGSAVRVDVSYRHQVLFGLVRWPATFTANSTMPGVLSTPQPGDCHVVPTPGPTWTPPPPPTNTPTSTPTPIPPTPTNTFTPTVTRTPTMTRTPTSTPTVTLTPTVTPTVCPYSLAAAAYRPAGGGQQPLSVKATVRDAQNNPVVGAQVRAFIARTNTSAVATTGAGGCVVFSIGNSNQDESILVSVVSPPSICSAPSQTVSTPGSPVSCP
jgi:Flp pilus assembly protein TadG